MKLPSSIPELNGIFRSASMPFLPGLEGEYLVDMLTYWPSFRRFSHRKVLYRKDRALLGHNVIFNRIWGRFFVEEGFCPDFDSAPAAVINYQSPKNSVPVRRIRDCLRCVEKDILFIGRFYYVIADKMHFLGYFSLEKIQ